MLKTLLSGADIEKRRLQLQLEMKVRVSGGARSAGAEHPHDLPFQITENKELARACEQLRAGAGAYSPMTLSPRDINSPARQ